MLNVLVAAEQGGGHTEFSLLAVLVGLLLLIGNGFFVAAEIALLAARRSRVEEEADRDTPGAERALQQLRELSVTFTGAQLGITMCSLGLGLIAEPAVAALFTDVLGRSPLPPGLVPAMGFVVALALVVFLHMVVGEMAPKNLAIAQAEQLAFRLSRPFGWYITSLRPLIILLNGAANGLVRMVRVEPVDEHKLVHSSDELIMALVESGDIGTISAQDARVMGAALRLATTDAASVMTPRVDVHALPDSATRRDVLTLASETGHTRFPVYASHVDEIVGVVHVKDALRCYPERRDAAVAQLMRPIPAVPGSLDLEYLLQSMLDEHTHAVVVVDEHGATAGLLTLEDVLEELVGDIADEFDAEDDVTRGEDGTWTVPGGVRRDEFMRLVGIDLSDEEGDAETLSGFVVERLGRLPRTGDVTLTPDGWRLTVVELDGFRAAQIEVQRPAPERLSQE